MPLNRERPLQVQGGRHRVGPPGRMETHAGSIAPTSAAAVKPSEREAIFSNYREFCKEEGLNGDCYPIKPHALKAFASAVGIGRKSRKARKLRRILKDILAGPARRHAAVRPKNRPAQGPARPTGPARIPLTRSLPAWRHQERSRPTPQRPASQHQHPRDGIQARPHPPTGSHAPQHQPPDRSTTSSSKPPSREGQNTCRPTDSENLQRTLYGRQRSVLPATLLPRSHECRCMRGPRWHSSCSGSA